MSKIISGITLMLLLLTFAAVAQVTTEFNLPKLLKENRLRIIHREAKSEGCDNYPCITLNQDFEEGVAWLNDVTFSEGTIDVDLKGKDLFQHSFIGIAFNAVNDSTFEAIYFRPFQFQTTDEDRKNRMIQYISLPLHTWRKLREAKPGAYEHTVTPLPNASEWFHARIVISKTDVAVYVNNSTTASLQVDRIPGAHGPMIGLYTADQSGGTFANLKISRN